MSETRQKGIITLSIPRSGTSWLGTLTKHSGLLGNAGEWLGLRRLPNPPGTYTANTFYNHILSAASTENGRFALKVFPQHQQDVTTAFNFDILQKLRADHDVKFLLLLREDRIGQAISLERAVQTGQWSSKITKSQKNRPPRYSFKKLCRTYFQQGYGYQFWRNYLALTQTPYTEFTYETLLENPQLYLDTFAQHMEIPSLPQPETPLTPQRDELSAQWRQRFLEDIARYGIGPDTYTLPQPAKGWRSAARVLLGKPLPPVRGRFLK